MQKHRILILALGLFTYILPAQVHRCASSEATALHFEKHPELKEKFDAYQASITAKAKASKANRVTATPNYTIPMVFHVLHSNGVENISDAQVMNAVNVLNIDFAKKNTDFTNTLPEFVPIADSTSIRFALATKDPNGNCTNGIVHYFNPDANWDDSSPTLYSQGWDPTKYLNIYVVKTITLSNGFSAAGYTYLPGTWSYGAPQDAIVVLHNYTGTIGTSTPFNGHVLTHEVGHWLDLNHVFGWNSCGVDCNNDDFVGDTPQTPGYLNCPSVYDICSSGIHENYQNFMDYSYCETMFTHEQALRMDAAAHDGWVGRDNLWTASNLIATGVSPTVQCAPLAHFKSNLQVVCAGQSVTYTDQSTVGVPTSWSWYFEGGVPSTSNLQNPIVSYSVPGSYSVQLVTGNSIGNSAPETKLDYMTVVSPPLATSLSESFEGSSIPNSLWNVKNVSMANTNWEQTNSAAATGSKSIFVSENISPSSVAELISPAFDFSSISGVALTFKWAGSERNTSSSSFDVLTIFFSTNCGATWTQRLARNIKSTTAGISGSVNGNFYPTAGQFKQEGVVLTGLTTASNILFKFKFTSESGSSNNFYLDDINLTGTTDLKNQNQVMNFSVFPNPANQDVYINFDLLENKTIEIKLMDVLGRTAKLITKQIMEAGNHEEKIQISDLSKGIYFVNLSIDGVTITQKLVVE